MRLAQIGLRNFASHKDTVVGFSESDRIVLVRGLNGSGKSFLMDSVPFALYGKVDRGNLMRPRQLVRDGQETAEAEVILEGEQEVRVRRRVGRKSTNVRLFVDGDERSARLAKGTQERIEAALGFSYSSFMSASYLNQGKVGAFTDGKSADRVRILTDVLNLALVDEAAQKAKVEMRRLADQKELISGKVEFLGAEAERLGSADDIVEEIQEKKDQKRIDERALGRLRKLRERLNARDELQRDYSASILNLRSEAKNREKSVARLSREIERDVEERQKLGDALKKMVRAATRIERLEELLAENPYPEKEVEDQIEGQAVVAADLAFCGKQLADLGKILEKGGACPTCRRDVEAGHEEIQQVINGFKKERRLLVKKQAELNKQNKELQDKIERHREVAASLHDANRQVANKSFLDEQLESYKKRIFRKGQEKRKDELEIKAIKARIESKGKAYKKKMAKFDDLDDSQDMESVNEEIDDLNTIVGKAASSISHLQDGLKRVKEIAEAIESFKTEAKKASGSVFYYEYWSDRFPKIKLGLIDVFVPQMEEVANAILASFSPIRLELSTVMEKKSGGFMDRFRIVVYEGKVAREWENWSGGEKKQVAIAICLAMNTTLWNMGFGLDFILMDEVFSDLDIEKRPLVLEYLVDSGRNVVVISHTDINPSFFHRVLTVNKANRVSKVDG